MSDSIVFDCQGQNFSPSQRFIWCQAKHCSRKYNFNQNFRLYDALGSQKAIIPEACVHTKIDLGYSWGWALIVMVEHGLQQSSRRLLESLNLKTDCMRWTGLYSISPLESTCVIFESALRLQLKALKTFLTWHKGTVNVETVINPFIS